MKPLEIVSPETLERDFFLPNTENDTKNPTTTNTLLSPIGVESFNQRKKSKFNEKLPPIITRKSLMSESNRSLVY